MIDKAIMLGIVFILVAFILLPELRTFVSSVIIEMNAWFWVQIAPPIFSNA